MQENPDGIVNKYKVGFVTKGYRQQFGFYFNEKFIPVVKPTTIRVILTLALSHKLGLQQVDINNVFLNGFLHEEMYMSRPSGFEKEDPSLIFELHKALYILKQSHRVWYGKLTQTLVHFGFTHSKCDISLHLLSPRYQSLYIGIYR